MPANNHWMYQGRQYHQWFGHGTAPKEDPDPIRPGSLFDAASIAQRLDYAVGHVVGAASRNERSRWETRLGGTARESLKTLVAAWYGARGKSRDTFRGQLLDPYTSDETVDQLRSAVKGIVEGRTHEQLGAAGEALASAAFKIGLDAWPRFLGDSQRRAMDAVSAEVIPGVVKASVGGTDGALVSGGRLLGSLYLLGKSPPVSIADGTSGLAVQASTPTSASTPSPALSEKPTEPPSAAPAQAPLAPMTRFYAQGGGEERCIERCSDLALPTRDYGVSFRRCLATCTGQTIFPEWERFFPK